MKISSLKRKDETFFFLFWLPGRIRHLGNVKSYSSYLQKYSKITKMSHKLILIKFYQNWNVQEAKKEKKTFHLYLEIIDKSNLNLSCFRIMYFFWLQWVLCDVYEYSVMSMSTLEYSVMSMSTLWYLCVLCDVYVYYAMSMSTL
jgi:hypothetical protein